MPMLRRTITYHWVLLAACFLMMMASLGVVVNCFNLYAVELISKQGYSASNIQTIGMISTIASLLGGRRLCDLVLCLLTLSLLLLFL